MSEIAKDGMLLEFVAGADQTFEMCLTAVKQNGRALQFCKIIPLPINVCRAALANTMDAAEFVPRDILEYLLFLQRLRKLAKNDRIASMSTTIASMSALTMCDNCGGTGYV